MSDFKGRNAVVIGGGGGIGRGVALALARRGVNVLVGDVRLAAAEAVAAELAGVGVEAGAAKVDVVDANEVEALAALAFERFPKVDILFNSPGAALSRRIAEATPEDWRRVMDVNFFGVVECCRRFIPRMKAAGGGHIVNNASMAALVSQAIPGIGLYTVSKQALMAYSEMLRNEEAQNGLRVSLLAAGRVASSLTENSQDYFEARDSGREPVVQAPPAEDAEVMPAETAGELIVRGIEAGRFLILTHPQRRQQIVDRYQAWLAEIDEQIAEV